MENSTNMREYVLVFLKKAYSATNDIADLQSDHLNYLSSLIDKGKLILAGPLLDDDDFKSICIYSCSLKETISIAEQDPAVKSGNLIFEVHRWFTNPSLLYLSSINQPIQLI